ncbi:MAG: glycosyltransferase family 4 protein [Cyanobacteriota bacterium]
MKKILFVSNEAARTGAPAIMLGLIKWLRAHHEMESICVLMRDGALREEFELVGRTYTWIPTDLNKPERIYKRLAKVVMHKGQADPGIWLTEIIGREKPDMIYLSTLVLGKYLQQLSKNSNQRIITHVHELLPSLRQLSNDQLVTCQLKNSDAVIACARCISDMLINIYHLPPNKIKIIPEYIIPDNSTHGGDQTRDSLTLSANERTLLGKLDRAIDLGIPIFGIGGNPIHRKGFDLFPLLIKECKIQFADTPFLAVWIGCGDGSEPQVALEWDLSHLGMKDEVALIPSVSMPTFRWIVSQFRVLTLLSREDPFPLVVLEAGLMGIPTVCFEGSGAIPEFAAEGQCVSVNYLDLPAFAAAVKRLCLDPAEATKVGEQCRQKVLNDLTLERVAPLVADVLFDRI